MLSDKQFFILLGITGVAIVGGVWYLKRAAEPVVDAITPTNPDNVFNSTFEKFYSDWVGDPDRTLGGDVADWVIAYRRSNNTLGE